MNQKTYYLIADIIQRYRTWIEVKDTEKLIEMRLLQDGMLKTLFYKGLSLQSYRDKYSFKKTRTWNINEYDLNQGLVSLCKKDPTAKRRIKTHSLTLRDVEYIIEKASFGIIKLELNDIPKRYVSQGVLLSLTIYMELSLYAISMTNGCFAL